MKRIGLLAIAALAACSDPDAARQISEVHGFQVISIDGYSVFGCGEDDTFATAVTLRGQNGQCVKAVVCSGWLKGGTLRVTGRSNECPSEVRAPQQ